MAKRRFEWIERGRQGLRIWGVVRPYLRPDRGLLAVGVLLSASTVALRLAHPWPVKWIIDHVAKSSGAVQLPIPGDPLQILVLLFIVLAVFSALAEYGQRIVLGIIGTRVVHRFRADLYAHVLRLPLSFHDRRDTGELLTRIVYDTSRLRQGVIAILTRFFQNGFFLVVAVLVLLTLDRMMAGVIALSAILSIVLMGRSGQRVRRASRRARRNEGRLAALVAEDLLSIRDLQTFRPNHADQSRFYRRNRRSSKQEQRVRRLAAGLLLRVDGVLAITVATVLWIGSHRVEAGLLTPGDLVLFITYSVALYRPYRQVARQAARFGRSVACAERLAKILSVQPTVIDKPDAIACPALRGSIRAEELWYRNPIRRQRGRKWALRSVSLDIAAGQRIAVMGRNGAGKSSLLRLLLRLADPDRGVVTLDGRDIRDYTLESVRQQVSVVFQNSVLFGCSVFDNLSLGQPDLGMDEVRRVTTALGLDRLISRMPEGYDTKILQRGKLLSEGERQRLAVARALLRCGAIWLLDEPTSALDPESRQRVMELLLDATANHTTFWVTHEEDTVALLDRVLVLDRGRVTFDGSPAAYQDSRANGSAANEMSRS